MIETLCETDEWADWDELLPFWANMTRHGFEIVEENPLIYYFDGLHLALEDYRHDGEVCSLVRWFYVEPFRRQHGKARRALKMLMSCAKEKNVKLICFSSLFHLETSFKEFVSNGAKDMILDDDIEADLEWQKILMKYGFEECPELPVSPESRKKGRSGLIYCPE